MIFLPWVVKEKIEVGPGQKIRDGSGTDPEQIRDGSGTDPGRIHYPDPSRRRIFVPGHLGTYVRTIYSGSVRRHCLRTYYVLSYTTHWIRHGITRIRLPSTPGFKNHRGLRTRH
jgi:hypothetical protein